MAKKNQPLTNDELDLLFKRYKENFNHNNCDFEASKKQFDDAKHPKENGFIKDKKEAFLKYLLTERHTAGTGQSYIEGGILNKLLEAKKFEEALYNFIAKSIEKEETEKDYISLHDEWEKAID